LRAWSPPQPSRGAWVYEGANSLSQPRGGGRDGGHGVPARQSDVKEERKGAAGRRPGGGDRGLSQSHRLAALDEAKNSARSEEGDFLCPALIEKPGRAPRLEGARRYVWPVISAPFRAEIVRWGRALGKPGAVDWVAAAAMPSFCDFWACDPKSPNVVKFTFTA